MPVAEARRRSPAPTAPAFYRGTFTLAGDRRHLPRHPRLGQGHGRGSTAITSAASGDIGPQQTLYIPGPWLRKGANGIVVFTLDTPAKLTMATLSAPVLNELAK